MYAIISWFNELSLIEGARFITETLRSNFVVPRSQQLHFKHSPILGRKNKNENKYPPRLLWNFSEGAKRHSIAKRLVSLCWIIRARYKKKRKIRSPSSRSLQTLKHLDPRDVIQYK